MDKINVIKLAIDTAKNTALGNYSAAENSETLRKAFIDANGGSTQVDFRSFRRHPELYDIIEELIPVIITEGFNGDEFFNKFVDYRNEALGDEIRFWTEDTSLFLVSEAGHGTTSVRRQRLNAGSYYTIATSLKAIKVFEELNRLLSGRVDFSVFVDRVGRSMRNRIYTDVFAAFDGISASTSGMSSTYYKSGSFSESTLITVIDHVEAGMAENASIIGTRSALRKITTAVVSDKAKEDMYNMGYYGNFNGTPMIVTKQKHAIGADTFLLDDSKVYIVAGGDKFIKVVDKGAGLLIDGNPTDNSDLTKEYFYGQEFGAAVKVNGKLGVYDIS